MFENIVNSEILSQIEQTRIIPVRILVTEGLRVIQKPTTRFHKTISDNAKSTIKEESISANLEVTVTDETKSTESHVHSPALTEIPVKEAVEADVQQPLVCLREVIQMCFPNKSPER